VIRLILANPVMTGAYQQGFPTNGKTFPDGSKIAKIVWKQKKLTAPPFSAITPDTVPGDLLEVELIEKDNKRFPDTHGWGYAVFDYDASSGFKPASMTSKSPQAQDAKCGAQRDGRDVHLVVSNRQTFLRAWKQVNIPSPYFVSHDSYERIY
jgi:hypothetical protein